MLGREIKMSVIKICVIGMITVLMALQLKAAKSEFSTLLMMVSAMLIFGFSISKIRQIIALIEEVRGEYSIAAGYIGVMVKIVGISYLCEFTSDICKDSGMSTLADQIQIFGKLSVFVTGIPVFLQLLQSLGSLL